MPGSTSWPTAHLPCATHGLPLAPCSVVVGVIEPHRADAVRRGSCAATAARSDPTRRSARRQRRRAVAGSPAGSGTTSRPGCRTSIGTEPAILNCVRNGMPLLRLIAVEQQVRVPAVVADVGEHPLAHAAAEQRDAVRQPRVEVVLEAVVLHLAVAARSGRRGSRRAARLGRAHVVVGDRRCRRSGCTA